MCSRVDRLKLNRQSRTAHHPRRGQAWTARLLIAGCLLAAAAVAASRSSLAGIHLRHRHAAAIGRPSHMPRTQRIVSLSPTDRPPLTAKAPAGRRPPGSLPQTPTRPSSHTLRFRREMSDLWQAIVLDRPRIARSAFFPIGAYLQLKAIAGAGADYTNRLLGDYALDIDAAHRLLGDGSASATLMRVSVVSAYAHWVPPDVCYNRVGYYEVPNSRIVYRESGKVRSFGIASMISWRGRWYVVHLGAILRPSDAGVVDQPASGAGVTEPSSTC